ncbi:MAG: tetratricopeptide repeat protein [Terriglobia bacterium]
MNSPRMNSPRMANWGGMLFLACLLLATSGCQKLKARDELNKGVQAYKAARYQLAIDHFKLAIESDPSLVNARLYLATAYANLFVPGSDAEDNLQRAEQSIEEFQQVLQMEANNIGSVSGIASLYFQMKRMDQAKEYYLKHIQLEPTNPEPYYSVAVINWTQTYQPRMVLKTRLRIAADAPITNAQERQALAERNTPLIDEGMQLLNKAMELREEYDDAMAYLNLLYREKADLVATPAEREELLNTANIWIDKALEVKKLKAERALKQSSTVGG